MKVLMIAPQPFFEPRGTPISVLQRLHGLSALGHEVDVVTYPIGKDVTIPGVRICRTLRIPFLKKIRIGPSWAKIPLDALLVLTVLGRLLRRRYDVIHSHEEGAFIAAVLAPLFRTPHLYDMHSSLPRQLENYGFGNYRPIVRLFEWLERRVLRSSDVVLTIGEDLETHVWQVNPGANQLRLENMALQETMPVDPEQAARLRNELGLEGKQVVVYTGTFERYQGFEVLFEALRYVAPAYPDLRVVMVGGKPEQVRHWQEETRQMGLGTLVLFTGAVTPEASLQYLEMADVLVSPRTEGLSVPLKIYTYLYAGRPIVATNIFAHTQVLDAETAVLVEPTGTAFAEGLRRLLDDPALAERLGRNARALAERSYARATYLRKLKLAYQSIEQGQPIRVLNAMREKTDDAQPVVSLES